MTHNILDTNAAGNSETEIWLGHYLETNVEFSNLGRVRRRVDPTPGQPFTSYTMLTGAVANSTGHRRVNFAGGYVYIHVAVLELFVCRRPIGMYGVHLDDDASNNTLANLRWATPSENSRTAARNGKLATNRRLPLSEAKKAEISNLWATGEYTKTAIAEQVGTTRFTVLEIVNPERLIRKRAGDRLRRQLVHINK